MLPTRTSLALLALLAAASLAPLALGQNETTPTPDPSSRLPGEEESVEGGPGQVYGIAILVGTIAIGGMLAYVTRKQRPRHP
jgi:hypothetical protein